MVLTGGFRLPLCTRWGVRPGSVDAGSCHELVREPAMAGVGASTGYWSSAPNSARRPATAARTCGRWRGRPPGAP